MDHATSAYKTLLLLVLVIFCAACSVALIGTGNDNMAVIETPQALQVSATTMILLVIEVVQIPTLCSTLARLRVVLFA